MATSLANYIVAIPAVLSVLAILACLARGLWVYQIFARRGFHMKDFEKMSKEAKILCAETTRVHKSIVQNETLSSSIRAACLEIVSAANEYDIGIRIALSAWEDIIYPAGGDSDAEIRKEEESEIRMTHRRYIIATMRSRCIAGIEERRRLSVQMQWMLMNVVSQYVVCYREGLWLMNTRISACLPDTMSGALPVAISDDELRKSIHTSNSMSSCYLPDLEMGDEKVLVHEVRPDPQETHNSQEKNIASERHRSLSLPPPLKGSFDVGPSLKSIVMKS